MEHLHEMALESAKMTASEVSVGYEEKFEAVVQKNYLYQLSNKVALPVETKSVPPLRWHQITKIVYDKGVFNADKLAMLYSSLHHTADCIVMSVQKSGNGPVRLFLGTRDPVGMDYVSAEILERGLKGFLPGLQMKEGSPQPLKDLFPEKLSVASVSCVGSFIDPKKDSFIQGVENLINSANSVPRFSAIFIAEKVSHDDARRIISSYEALYTAISPFHQVQLSFNETETKGVTDTLTTGFNESVSKNVSQTITTGSTHTHSTGTSHTETKSRGFNYGSGLSIIISKSFGVSRSKASSDGKSIQDSDTESMQRAEQSGSGSQRGTHEDNAHSNSLSTARGKTLQLSTDNCHVKKCMDVIDRQIKRIEKATASGLWSTATYFITSDDTTANKLASIYRGTMIGNQSDVEAVAINLWKSDCDKSSLISSIERGRHPIFSLPEYGLTPTAGSLVDSHELALHLSFPQSSVAGILVREESSFGRNVIRKEDPKEENEVVLGCITHLGDIYENERVKLDSEIFSKHTFITGTTGSGKSNALYLILQQLSKKGKKIMVIEPAKGEYKQVFGGRDGVAVFSTSTRFGKLLTVNPFIFPRNIDIYEHIDALIEVFSACWPMYAAMPQVLKHSIIEAYRACGWNLNQSYNPRNLYPTIEDVIDCLKVYINSSDYSNDTKGDYKGSLETRLNSLNEGLVGRLFNGTPVDDEELFNENVIIDLSTLRSNETKALLMGILIMKLNEFRMSEEKGMNQPLRHITVIEEAHNLLKRTSTVQNAETSNIAGMSVERIANSMAEMRTYGEGFIIADQSPSMLDLSTIRNTNTKIVLNLPEKEDQQVAGRSIGLNDQQIAEIPRLKLGESIVYQNSWEEPVKVTIDLFKADKVQKENSSDRETSEAESENRSLFPQLLSLLYICFRGKCDTETVAQLNSTIVSLNISGVRKNKALDLLDGGGALSVDDCSKLFSVILGSNLYDRVKQLSNFEQIHRIVRNYFKEQEFVCSNPHLSSFINMYFKGWSLFETDSFYNKWLMSNFKY